MAALDTTEIHLVTDEPANISVAKLTELLTEFCPNLLSFWPQLLSE